MDERELVAGAFYWGLITLDPDADEWENEPMPARYVGGGIWSFLATEGDSAWPVRWVGEQIKPAMLG